MHAPWHLVICEDTHLTIYNACPVWAHLGDAHVFYLHGMLRSVR